MRLLLITFVICTTFCPVIWASERLLPAPEQPTQEIALTIASRFSSLSDFVTQYHEGHVEVSASSWGRDIGPQDSKMLMDAVWDLESQAIQAPDDAALNATQLAHFTIRTNILNNHRRPARMLKRFPSHLPGLAIMGYCTGFLVPFMINEMIKKGL